MAKKERQSLVATGWYKYQNISGADLLLPRPLINGRTMIPRGGFFEADSSYQGIGGVQVIENLSHYLKEQAPAGHLLNKNKVQKQESEEPKKEEEQPQLLTDVAFNPESLQFFEADGTPIKESKTNKEKGIVDLTKKELVEFAQLKNKKVNPNWTKEKILQCIREE